MRGRSQEAGPLLNSPDGDIPDPLSPLGPHGRMHGCVQVVILASAQTLVGRHPAQPTHVLGCMHPAWTHAAIRQTLRVQKQLIQHAEPEKSTLCEIAE